MRLKSPVVRILQSLCIWLAVLVLNSGSGLTATATALASAESPPDPSGVTEVEIDIWGVSIFNIDDRNATFDVEAYINAGWLDERLAFDPEETGYERRVLQGEAVGEALKAEIWWPGFEVTDARRTRDIMQRSIEIDPDGWVWYQERFSVAVTQDYDFVNFPFDEHEISLTVAPWYYNNERVVFAPLAEPEETVDWEPIEWIVSAPLLQISNGLCSITDEQHCNLDTDCPATETCEGFAVATVALSIERLPSHYLTNIVVPMMLIVLISSAVFSMSFKTMHLGDRLGVSFTSVLTVVAFDFVASERLPNLPYSTVMDHILTLSYIFLAINVLQNVIAARINEHNPEAAAKLDRRFRWGFPLAYIALIGTIVVYAMSSY